MQAFATLIGCAGEILEAEAAVGDIAAHHQAAPAFRLDGATRDGGIGILGNMDDGNVGALANSTATAGRCRNRLPAIRATPSKSFSEPL